MPTRLALPPGPIVELTIGTKDIQCRLDPLPSASLFSYSWNARSPSSRLCSALGVNPHKFRPCRWARLRSRLAFSASSQSRSHPLPENAQEPGALPSWMWKTSSPFFQRNLVGVALVLLHLGDSRLESLARVAGHIIAARSRLQFSKPSRTFVIGRFGPQKPPPCFGAQSPPGRSAVEKDLIETADQAPTAGSSRPVA